MKTEITPIAVADFNTNNQPTIVSFTSRGIGFNRPAEKLLQLKQDSCFSLTFEDGLLFYKETTPSDLAFKVTTTGKNNCFVANSANINKYLSQFFKQKLNRYNFSIGEFKEGKRLLTLLNK